MRSAAVGRGTSTLQKEDESRCLRPAFGSPPGPSCRCERSCRAALRTCLPAAWIEVLDVFAGLTRFADDPVSVCLDDQILDFRRVMQG
jgi:hypothetical protein